MVFPETDLIRMVSELDITAKFLASPMELRYSLMDVMTACLSMVSSSSIGERVKSCRFRVGMAPTWSETYTTNSCLIGSTSVQSTVSIVFDCKIAILV